MIMGVRIKADILNSMEFRTSYNTNIQISFIIILCMFS